MNRELKFSAKAEGRPLVPYWNFCAGAGRANEGLRAGWRDHLKTAVTHCGFRNLRFHGLLHDDMFVCRKNGPNLVFNWQYIDDLFDALLAVGIRPFVEFGFFPKDIAGESDVRCFWWKAHVTPPEDYRDWSRLVDALVRHWIRRYGLQEVKSWYFEVWNEPNLPFFFNGPRARYFELYRDTAETIKNIDASLKVGGPATSNFVPDGRFDEGPEDRSKLMPLSQRTLEGGDWRAIWIPEFFEYCHRNKLPVDFISSHPYPCDFAIDDGNQGIMHARGAKATTDDLRWLRKAVDNSPFPHAEIHLTEWSTSASDKDYTHDFPQAAAFVVKANLESSGLVDSLSYWTFTDVFEEHGAGNAAFHGGFGMITYQGIVKPTFHAYRFLNQLGEEEIFRSDGFVATRDKNRGTLIAVAYHYPEEQRLAPRPTKSWEEACQDLGAGSSRSYPIQIRDLEPGSVLAVEVVDAESGFAGSVWRQIGSPHSPSRAQTEWLKECGWATKRSVVTADETGFLNLSLKLAPWSIACIREVK